MRGRPNHYKTLDDYNADVEKARNAYAADMAYENGLCAVCQVNVRDNPPRSESRRCPDCKKTRRKEGTR